MAEKKKILIVDDDQELIRVMNIYFQRSGMTPHVVDGGRKALKAVKSFQPDIIILDVKMPRMGGIEVCEKIRKEDKKLPIIALTGYHKEEARRKVMAAGASLYLTKPVEMGKLLDYVKKLTGLKPASKSEAAQSAATADPNAPVIRDFWDV